MRQDAAKRMFNEVMIPPLYTAGRSTSSMVRCLHGQSKTISSQPVLLEVCPSDKIASMKMREGRSKSMRTKRQPQDHQDSDMVVQAKMGSDWKDAAGFPLLPDMQPVSTVRDSLYDLIPLGSREEKLISTAAFLRLQQIKQLGFVYRIWPGATHTRYEHSLGCYHLAVRALRSLLQRSDNGGLNTVSISSVQTLVVAALLHDIG